MRKIVFHYQNDVKNIIFRNQPLNDFLEKKGEDYKLTMLPV